MAVEQKIVQLCLFRSVIWYKEMCVQLLVLQNHLILWIILSGATFYYPIVARIVWIHYKFQFICKSVNSMQLSSWTVVFCIRSFSNCDCVIFSCIFHISRSLFCFDFVNEFQGAQFQDVETNSLPNWLPIQSLQRRWVSHLPAFLFDQC